MLRLERAKVLVIDDNRHIRDVVRAVLHANVAELRDCACAYAALEAWPEWSPDLAIVDYEMPKMDGIVFGRVVRDLERGRARRTALVMMTGHSGGHVVREAVKAGFDGFISKPISVGAVLQRVERALIRADAHRRRPPSPPHAAAG